MSQPVLIAGIGKAIRKRSLPGNVQWLCRRPTVRVAAAWILAFICLEGIAANGQMPSASSQNASQSPAVEDAGSPDFASSATGYGEDARDNLTARSSPAQQSALSADQIIDILQRNPDVSEELKARLADRLQQQGVQVDASGISDQMLDEQINSSPELRASITTVLRARGYAPDSGLRSGSSLSVNDDEANAARFDESAISLAGNTTENDGRALVSGDLLRTNAIDSSPTLQASRIERSQHPPTETLRGQQKANASTDIPKTLPKPTPYNLQSMRDLYAQIPSESAPLKRFGSEMFLGRSLAAGRGVSSSNIPLDVPIGPDYVVGAGDTLTIQLWGGTTQSIVRAIDRDGRIFLPEAGSVEVAGLPLDKVQKLIENVLKPQFRNVEVAVSVSGLRTVRVYIVGDVQRPGGYDLSSLATPLSALYAAGGPTAVGSLRTLYHYRGKQLVESIDLYDFLLHGIRSGSAHFESGDTLLAPPAGAQVAVSGTVKRPAIYELKTPDATLAAVIEDAGGLTAAASLQHIRIERIDVTHRRQTVTLQNGEEQKEQDALQAMASFQVKDGDRINIEPILPYSQRAIYLAGHVARPGRMPYTDGMQLNDILRSYQDMLPEPANHGEIVRLIPPDLHAETIAFSVPDVLIGNEKVGLRPFDTIRIYGRYQVDAPTVTIRGEVLRPGMYPMSDGMTAAQLVRMAGGFKRDALLESADLTSYDLKDGNRISENLATIPIGAALDGTNSRDDVALKPGDILSIHQITNWKDIGQSVTIEGQVRYPGSYGFRDGERLSSVLRRAGGFLPAAYSMGAVLKRVEVRDLEQKSRDELVRQIETNSASARLSPALSGTNAAGAAQLIKAQEEQVLADLKSHPPTGRMVIQIRADIDSWANTPADIELREGDVLTIPKKPGFVLVTGQVYNSTALTFASGKSAGWYLSRAGGTNATANRKDIFIIRANGSVVGRHSGSWFEGDVLSTQLNPGDVIVVPQKLIGGSLFWRNLLTTAQLASSVALTAGIASTAL